MENGTFRANLNHLNQHGYLLVEQALDSETVRLWARTLFDLYNDGEYQVHNSVGNVAFEKLLELQPERSRDLVGHESVAPYLKSVLGRQCQLRSMRAHLNPGDYLQEWHMDFYDYWYQEEKAEASRPVVGTCMNTTFLLDRQYSRAWEA